VEAKKSISEWKYGLVRGARSGYGNGAGSIQTEKPDSGVASLVVHIRSDVDLVKVRDPRQRRRQDGTDTGEREGHEPHVRVSIERVDRQLGGNESLQLLGTNLPVQEQEMVPVLMHHHRRVRLERRCDAIDHIQRRHGNEL